MKEEGRFHTEVLFSLCFLGGWGACLIEALAILEISEI